MKRSVFFFLCLSFALASPGARAGDEDVKEEKKAVEAKTPEDTALPQEEEEPELSVSKEPEKPIPVPEEAAPAPKKQRKMAKQRGPDDNIDYSGLLGRVNAFDPPRGVLPPALGFRGYRPNMIALGVGDRTPGYGAMLEYSWNRVGAGIYGSYLNHKGGDRLAASSAFAGLYVLYRWLPFDISPYILVGGELGSETDEVLGGTTGLGMEARLVDGITLLLGWTYHSTVRRGYFGGALGWSF